MPRLLEGLKAKSPLTRQYLQLFFELFQTCDTCSDLKPDVDSLASEPLSLLSDHSHISFAGAI